MMFKRIAMLEHLQKVLHIYSENPEMSDVMKNIAVFFDDFSSPSRFQARFDGQSSTLAIGSSEEGQEPRLDGIRNATLPKFEAFVGSLGEAEAAFATLFHNICTDQYNDEFMKLAEGDVTRVGERPELDKFLRCEEDPSPLQEAFGSFLKVLQKRSIPIKTQLAFGSGFQAAGNAIVTDGDDSAER